MSSGNDTCRNMILGVLAVAVIVVLLSGEANRPCVNCEPKAKESPALKDEKKVMPKPKAVPKPKADEKKPADEASGIAGYDGGNYATF